MRVNPLTQIDFYKADHRRQYPLDTTKVYSNFTPRSTARTNLIPEKFDNKITFFGLQYFMKHFLIELWGKGFFGQHKDKVVSRYNLIFMLIRLSLDTKEG